MSDSEVGDDASLFGESNAPDAVPQHQMNASEHDQQAGNWAGRGRGRAGGRGGTGRGRGRGASAGNAGNAGGGGAGAGGSAGGGVGSDGAGGAHPSTALVLGDDGSGDGPTFTGISLKDLEFRLRNNKDGAESSLCTDDESVASRKRPRAPNGSAPASRGKAVARRKSASDGAADELGAAVFGNQDEDFGDAFDDDEEDEDLGASESASQAEGAGLAPIRGERCPGCILDRETVGHVEKFVRENAMVMSETPLFKAAALFYEQKVLAAHRREGVRCCKWPWKSIREHFSLHVVDPVLARISVIRTLGNIRSFSESNLVRVDGDGSKQLDPKQIELLLKVSAVSATSVPC